MDRLASHCRYCRFYTPEGRRGGQCAQLGVNVSGSWQSCDLSIAPFAPSWESSEPFPSLRQGRPLKEAGHVSPPVRSVQAMTNPISSIQPIPVPVSQRV